MRRVNERKGREEMIRVVQKIQRTPPKLVQQYIHLSSATVYEASGGRGALSSRIKLISPDIYGFGDILRARGLAEE